MEQTMSKFVIVQRLFEWPVAEGAIKFPSGWSGAVADDVAAAMVQAEAAQIDPARGALAAEVPAEDAKPAPEGAKRARKPREA